MATHFHRKSFHGKSSQSGAALIVGLLLLLVLTLLAISGVNTASMELTMAGNMQYQQNAFQAAETGIAQELAVGSFNPSTPAVVQAAVAMPGSTTDTYATTIASQLNGSAQPAIWGDSWDSFSTFHFEIQSTGRSVRNAVTTNVQGVAVIAPMDSTVQPGGGLGTTVLQ